MERGPSVIGDSQNPHTGLPFRGLQGLRPVEEKFRFSALEINIFLLSPEGGLTLLWCTYVYSPFEVLFANVVYMIGNFFNRDEGVQIGKHPMWTKLGVKMVY